MCAVHVISEGAVAHLHLLALPGLLLLEGGLLLMSFGLLLRRRLLLLCLLWRLPIASRVTSLRNGVR